MSVSPKKAKTARRLDFDQGTETPDSNKPWKFMKFGRSNESLAVEIDTPNKARLQQSLSEENLFSIPSQESVKKKRRLDIFDVLPGNSSDWSNSCQRKSTGETNSSAISTSLCENEDNTVLRQVNAQKSHERKKQEERTMYEKKETKENDDDCLIPSSVQGLAANLEKIQAKFLQRSIRKRKRAQEVLNRRKETKENDEDFLIPSSICEKDVTNLRMSQAKFLCPKSKQTSANEVKNRKNSSSGRAETKNNGRRTETVENDEDLIPSSINELSSHLNDAAKFMLHKSPTMQARRRDRIAFPKSPTSKVPTEPDVMVRKVPTSPVISTDKFDVTNCPKQATISVFGRSPTFKLHGPRTWSEAKVPVFQQNWPASPQIHIINGNTQNSPSFIASTPPAKKQKTSRRSRRRSKNNTSTAAENKEIASPGKKMSSNLPDSSHSPSLLKPEKHRASEPVLKPFSSRSRLPFYPGTPERMKKIGICCSGILAPSPEVAPRKREHECRTSPSKLSSVSTELSTEATSSTLLDAPRFNFFAGKKSRGFQKQDLTRESTCCDLPSPSLETSTVLGENPDILINDQPAANNPPQNELSPNSKMRKRGKKPDTPSKSPASITVQQCTTSTQNTSCSPQKESFPENRAPNEGGPLLTCEISCPVSSSKKVRRKRKASSRLEKSYDEAASKEERMTNNGLQNVERSKVTMKKKRRAPLPPSSPTIADLLEMYRLSAKAQYALLQNLERSPGAVKTRKNYTSPVRENRTPQKEQASPMAKKSLTVSSPSIADIFGNYEVSTQSAERSPVFVRTKKIQVSLPAGQERTPQKVEASPKTLFPSSPSIDGLLEKYRLSAKARVPSAPLQNVERSPVFIRTKRMQASSPAGEERTPQKVEASPKTSFPSSPSIDELLEKYRLSAKARVPSAPLQNVEKSPVVVRIKKIHPSSPAGGEKTPRIVEASPKAMRSSPSIADIFENLELRATSRIPSLQNVQTSPVVVGTKNIHPSSPAPADRTPKKVEASPKAMKYSLPSSPTIADLEKYRLSAKASATLQNLERSPVTKTKKNPASSLVGGDGTPPKAKKTLTQSSPSIADIFGNYELRAQSRIPSLQNVERSPVVVSCSPVRTKKKDRETGEDGTPNKVEASAKAKKSSLLPSPTIAELLGNYELNAETRRSLLHSSKKSPVIAENKKTFPPASAKGSVQNDESKMNSKCSTKCSKPKPSISYNVASPLVASKTRRPPEPSPTTDMINLRMQECIEKKSHRTPEKSVKKVAKKLFTEDCEAQITEQSVGEEVEMIPSSVKPGYSKQSTSVIYSKKLKRKRVSKLLTLTKLKEESESLPEENKDQDIRLSSPKKLEHPALADRKHEELQPMSQLFKRKERNGLFVEEPPTKVVPVSPILEKPRSVMAKFAAQKKNSSLSQENPFLPANDKKIEKSPKIFTKKELHAIIKANIETQAIDEFNTETIHLVPSGTKGEAWSSEGKISEILSEERARKAAASEEAADIIDNPLSDGPKKRETIPKEGPRAEVHMMRKTLASERRVRAYERQKADGNLPGGKDLQVLETWGRFPQRVRVMTDEGEAMLVIGAGVVKHHGAICPGAWIRIFPPWDILEGVNGEPSVYLSIRTCQLSYERLPEEEKPVFREVACAPYLADPSLLVRTLLNLPEPDPG